MTSILLARLYFCDAVTVAVCNNLSYASSCIRLHCASCCNVCLLVVCCVNLCLFVNLCYFLFVLFEGREIQFVSFFTHLDVCVVALCVCSASYFYLWFSKVVVVRYEV